MGKVTQVNNGDKGVVARSNWNEAMKTVETDGTTLSGDGTVGSSLGVILLDEDDFASDSATLPATQQSIKAYVDQTEAAIPAVKSYTFRSKAANGIEFIAGYYEAPAADANLTQASTTVNYGTANIGYGAHAFIVAGAAGTTDGSDLVLTVSGTSFASDGTRTPADSEVVVADCTAAATDQYFETTKKWIGQITYTLSSTGGTTFSFDFNYGISKYDDLNNRWFQLEGVEFVGEASANDSGFNLELLLHDGTGWTYSAAAFAPGGTVLVNMQTDYNTEYQLSNNEYFAYKRTDLVQLIDGTSDEGIVIRVTTTSNNAVDYMDAHITFLFTDSIIT